MKPPPIRLLSACACPFALALVIAGTFQGPPAAGDDSAGRPAAEPKFDFVALHALIKRQPGESRWMEVDWYPSVWEGRQAAAAAGKPLLLMAGSGGAPAAAC